MGDEETEEEEGGFSIFQVRDSQDEALIFQSMDLDGSAEDGLRVRFVFSFCNETTFASDLFLEDLGLEASLESYRALFNVGMCVLTWYWMGFGCRSIYIAEAVASRAAVDQAMLDYWKEALDNVLAEYFYVNKISLTEIHIAAAPYLPDSAKIERRRYGAAASDTHTNHSVIVPLGGGKDSLVVWHMLSASRPLLLYVSDGFDEFDRNHRLADIVAAAGSDKSIIRHDFHYDSIAREGRSYRTPCGHPWAALVMFDSLLVAHCLHNCPATPVTIALGYEKSADEGNNVFLPHTSIEVNHQYDKSSSFVALTMRYLRRLDCPFLLDTPLAHMYELEIVRVFCEEPALRPFHRLFLSCNEPVGYSQWCAKCDKCAFIFLLLSAFLEPAYLTATVFPKDMLADALLVSQFLQLVQHDGPKPFDCVGTVQEARAALLLTAALHRRIARPFPVVLQSLCRACGFPPSEEDDFWADIRYDAELLAMHPSQGTS